MGFQLRKATTLGFLKSSGTSRWRELILCLYSFPVRFHLEYYIQLWGFQQKKIMDFLEEVKKRATKVIGRLEQLAYEERLRELFLGFFFNLEK